MKYEINADTLLIAPVSEEKCRAIEKMATYDVDMPTFEVIERSCEYFGSTLEGRLFGTKSLIGISHKAPIFIEESSKIIFFPLNSPKKSDCVWVSFNNILNYRAGTNPKTSIIKFKNGEEIEIPASIGSVTNQILRASRLQVVLEARKQRI